MRRKFAVKVVNTALLRIHGLTISLGSLNFLQKALEPAKRRGVSANPEEFYPTQATEMAASLTIPYMFQNRREGGNTFSNISRRIRYETA